MLNITTESINDKDITPQSATYPARTESISRPSFTHSPTSGTAVATTKHDQYSTTVTDAATMKHYSPATAAHTSQGNSENTTQLSQTLPQDDSDNSTIIMASVAGFSVFVLLLVAMVLVVAWGIYRQVSKSRQTCLNGENTPNAFRDGYSNDNHWPQQPHVTWISSLGKA